ncbi:TagA-related protein [Photobacterium aphoticum]|uniref:TagA-related protein n=1 Tax=Photobacterium aphoticum TaxID=754436 RepID=A0A090QRJ7_9GAMM|nr:TagA-related protein [Photobacterium aphoticum]
MKRSVLATAIGALLLSQAPVAVSATSLQPSTSPSTRSQAMSDVEMMVSEMAQKVQSRVNEVIALADDPKNWEVRNGRRYFRYNDYLYPMSPDNKPLFMPFVLGASYEENLAYADRSAEAMFDFVKAPWRLVNEQDGVFIFHDQFGFSYMDWDKKCHVRYLTSGVTQETKDCLPLDQKAVDGIGFIDELDVENHLVGNFAAQIRFVQNQTSEPTGNADKSQQKLVTHRDALLVLTPEKDSLDEKAIEMRVYKDGALLEKRILTNPTQIMKTDRVGMDDRPDILFSKRSYTTVLPWNWVEQGLSFTFMTYDGREGELSADAIEFGAPIHVDMPMIRIGMLTEPPAVKPLEEKMGNYGAELFQRFPFSTMTLSPYLPVQLDKIVTAYGEVEEDYSYFEKPDVYSGDLRENITKSLIQTGINNANYGVTSSAGTHQWQPGYYPTVVIGHSIGRYKKKDGTIENVTHGLSGGNGMALLVDSTANEVTHEIGHAFSLWHWPGGPDTYYHSTRSGWGYDAYRGRMTDNVVWYENGSGDRNFAGIVGFGKDPMAGGNFDSRVNSYPLFTGYTSKVMQDYLTGFDFLDMNSPSGYAHWDAEKQVMTPVDTTTKLKPVQRGVDVMTMVGYYDPQNTNTSYIYPPMYGSAGQVYDLPAPIVGQCWATVTYVDGREQQIGLHGVRHDGNMSNKFHLNLAREANPQSMVISCPQRSLQTVVTEQILADVDQTRFFEWGENNRQGTPGDVFSYHRNGRIELFRLNTTSYWYFPDSGSNHEWTFLGYMDDFVEQYVAEQNPSFDSLGEVALTERTFTANSEYPQRAITFGQGQGYDHGVEHAPTFAQISELANRDFVSIGEFERELLTLEAYQLFAGNYRINDGHRANARFIGALYAQWNEETGTRDYFMMKQVDAGAMPLDQQSNVGWKFLGSAQTYVNMDLNPILIDREGDDHATRMQQYFGVEALLTWDQRATTTQPFAIFVQTQEDGSRAYFMQKWRVKAKFPSGEYSNADWLFITNDQLLTEQLVIWQDQGVFEQDLLDWYRQDRMREWGDDGQWGTPGDVYEYDFQGGRHYYRLKTGWYGYFPWPSASADPSDKHWQYLGHF